MTWHPDLNLLAAYVERRLPRKERKQVLGHMADCDRCRRIAFLVKSTGEAVRQRDHAGWWQLRSAAAWTIWRPLSAALGCALLVWLISRSPVSRPAVHPPAGTAWTRKPVVPVRALGSIGELGSRIPVRAELPALDSASIGIDFAGSDLDSLHEQSLICIGGSGSGMQLTRCIPTVKRGLFSGAGVDGRRYTRPIAARPVWGKSY